MKTRIISLVAVFTVAISISGVPACDRQSADLEIHDMRSPTSSVSFVVQGQPNQVKMTRVVIGHARITMKTVKALHVEDHMVLIEQLKGFETLRRSEQEETEWQNRNAPRCRTQKTVYWPNEFSQGISQGLGDLVIVKDLGE